jgi:hypothetical protein
MVLTASLQKLGVALITISIYRFVYDIGIKRRETKHGCSQQENRAPCDRNTPYLLAYNIL